MSGKIGFSDVIFVVMEMFFIPLLKRKTCLAYILLMAGWTGKAF
jgi:hypothetical protein